MDKHSTELTYNGGGEILICIKVLATYALGFSKVVEKSAKALTDIAENVVVHF